MCLFPKTAILLLGVALGLTPPAPAAAPSGLAKAPGTVPQVANAAKPAKSDSTKDAAKASTDAKTSADADDDGTTGRAASEPGSGKSRGKDKNAGGGDNLDLPVPKGQPQKEVNVPFYDTKGHKTMNFKIGVATWVDEDNVKMQKLRVETFKDDDTRELDMDLPDAMMNKRTKVISSNTAVTIKRDDFQITGNTMAFNIETKAGTLGGGVKMIIYNLKDTANGPDHKTSFEFHPENAVKPASDGTKPPANEPSTPLKSEK